MENFYVIVDSPSTAPTMAKNGIVPRNYVHELIYIRFGPRMMDVIELVANENGIVANNIVIGEKVYNVLDFTKNGIDYIRQHIEPGLELGKNFSVTFEMYSDMIKLMEMRFTVIPA